MTAVCSARGIVRSFGPHTVLHGVDLDLEPGELVALTGPSGSGKSTMLNILGLLDKPDSGEVRYRGRLAPKTHSGAARRLLRTTLGYLFQNFALIDQDTVGANLVVAQTAVTGSRVARARARAEALERVGLSGRERQRVFELSGGEQQRLAIARLLLKPCDLVLADEPTGSLDEANRATVVGLLRQMGEAGKAVLIVTHDPVVAASCDRTIALNPGNMPG